MSEVKPHYNGSTGWAKKFLSYVTFLSSVYSYQILTDTQLGYFNSDKHVGL